MKRHFWQDSYGEWNLPTCFGVGILTLVAIVVVIVALTAHFSRLGCEQRLDAFHLDGHYSFWANTCFAELPGGAVNVNNLRQNSQGYTLYTPDLPPAR